MLKLNPFLSRKTGATELYLIRHADALPGQETVIPGGGYDSQPLSELGQRQAQALGRWLAGVRFDALYSSPLRRTQETAAPLAALQNLPVNLEPDLREVRLSMDVDGFMGDDGNAADTAKALRDRLNEILRLVGQTGKWSSVPGSEASQPFRTRVVGVVEEIAARHAGQRVAIFSHGGVINVFFAELLGLENDMFFPIHNTSVSVARYQAGQACIVSLNGIPHLQAAQVETED